LLNNTDSALSYLEKALSLNAALHEDVLMDPDFYNIKNKTRFSQIMNRYKSPQ
jgi:hypothetical protein